MAYWNMANPAKPTGLKDADDKKFFIPVSFQTWLVKNGYTYVSHTVQVTGGLTVDSSTFNQSGAVELILSDGTPGELASFTIRITVSDGTINDITKDQTLYLRIRNG